MSVKWVVIASSWPLPLLLGVYTNTNLSYFGHLQNLKSVYFNF